MNMPNFKSPNEARLEAENEQLYDLLDKWKHNSMQWKNLFIGVSIMLIGHMIALAIILIKGA